MNEREARPSLGALMEERLLGIMPTNVVGVPPEAPLPRLSAYRQVDRAKICPIPSVRPSTLRCHNGVFQHHYYPLCFPLFVFMPIVRLVG